MSKSNSISFSKSRFVIFYELDTSDEEKDLTVFSNRDTEYKIIEIGKEPIIGGRDIPKSILIPVRTDGSIIIPELNPATGGVWGHTDKREGVLIGERGGHVKIEVRFPSDNIDINFSPRFGISARLRLTLDGVTYYTYDFIEILSTSQYANYPVLSGKKFKEIALFLLRN